MRVVVGVSGGIAAYKAVLVVRALSERGHDVRVIPTAAALRFIGAPTWEALTRHPVSAEIFEDVANVPHVRLGQWADVVAVVPATADLMARAVAGRADDLLTATLLTICGPVLMAPAMHTEMWQHAATVANVATLRRRGVIVVEPDSGRLTGADSGPGRLPDPDRLVAQILSLDPSVQDHTGSAAPAVAGALSGKTVLVSAGGTQEPLDPVRYLGNRSSGRQGFAVAAAARALGARVIVIAANTSAEPPSGVELRTVGTALELEHEVRAAAAEADVVVMAAAVADFRPATAGEHKMKKSDDHSGVTLSLVENPDILRGLVEDRPRTGQLLIGFAAETGDETLDVLGHARIKARRKGADLLVVNDVSGGAVFGGDENSVTVLDASGEIVGSASGTKAAVAGAIWQLAAPLVQ